jgi:hypothetical protein
MPTGSRPNPPAHVAHFSMEGFIDAVYPWANGFWVRNGNATEPSIGDLADFAEDVANEYFSNFWNEVSGRTSITQVRALYYGSSGADLGVDSSFAHVGAGGDDMLPANCAMCVSWKVQQRYKGGHARTYLPGIRSDILADASTFTSGVVAGVAAAANNMIDNVNALSRGDFGDAHMGIVSFVHANAWRSPPVFRDFVPGATAVDTRIDSQRRRLGRDR